jgi:hypothetical protein
MMRRLFLALAILVPGLLGLAPAPTAAAAAEPFRWEEVTVADLLADPEAHTTMAVVVRGELVGDFGRRDDGTVWTQLNGDAYAEVPLLAGGSLAGANLGIGVRIPTELWPGFDQPGGYRARGPLVELQGRWRYHDLDRGGESYLDVTGLELLEPPLALEEGVRWVALGLGAGLLALAAAVGLRTRRRAA